MRTPVFSVDRAKFSRLADLFEAVGTHIADQEIVHVVDSEWPESHQLRYTIQWTGGAGHVFDGLGLQLGVFADLQALIEHAETVTA